MLKTFIDFVRSGVALRAENRRQDRLANITSPRRRWLDCTELEDRTLLSAAPLAAAALVNTTTTGVQQTLPESPQAVASDANGNFVVVWTSAAQDGSGLGIYAQRYNALGVKQGSEFLVNTTTANDQTEPAVAMNASGSFIITWSSSGQDGSGAGIYAQRYDASGNAQGGEFQVNTTTANDQTDPSIGIDSAGNFVISWTSDGQDGDGLGVYAQRFDSAGNKVGGEFQVNTTTSGTQDDSEVAMNASGAFVISFTTDSGGNPGIRAQIYNPSGIAQGGQIQVNTTTSGNQEYSSIAIDASGNFIVTWTSGAQDGDGNGIYAQQYDSAGNKVGTTEFLVNTTTANDQQYSRVAADASGNFVIVWESYDQDAASTWGIYAQQFDSSGTAVGAETLINSTTAGDQQYASVTMVAANQYDIVWSGNGTGDADGVFVRQYVAGANQPPVNSIPAAQSTNEDTALVFSSGNGNLISISDPDAAGNPVQVTLNATHGTLTLSGTTGLAFSSGTGTGDASMTFTGTITDINTALNGLTFSPVANYNGAASVQIITNDQGFTGTGGAKSDSETVNVTINAVNDAPVNTVPGAQSTNEDTSLVFSSGNGNAVSISDVDAGSNPVQVTLSVTNGTLTLNGTTGLSFSSGTGTGNATMTFTGTIANINTALNGLSYAPTSNYNGAATLSIATNDQGNTGSGGPLTASDTVNITVNAVNDPPVNSVPAAQSTNENTSLIFSSGNGNALSISDVDAGASSVQVTLSITNGTLSLNGTSGLSFSSGTGTADTTMTFTGTMANINTALNGLTYAPTSNYSGAATLSITTNDQGNTGSGGAKSDADTVNITVTAVNNPPVNAVPGAQSTNEDTPLVFSSGNGNVISISDSDAGSNPVQVTLSVTNGSLTLNGTAGLSFSSGTGTADTTMTFTGTIANINVALNGLSYAPTSNYNGSATLSITTNDQGNTGAGGAKSDSDSVNITVNAVNDAPVNAVPPAQSTNEDTPLVFSSGNGNAISISDVDAGASPVQVTLTVTNGSLSLNGTTGLVFSSGTGTADTTMTFTGTIANINTALNGLSYTPTLNYNGAATLSITTNDQGNTGSGGAKSDADSVNITVNAVNDPPVNIVPAAQTTNEDTPLVFSSGNGNAISISDVDAGANPVQVTLAVTNGTLTLSGTAGLSFSSGTGTANSTMTFTGTIANINTALSGLSYAPTLNYNGSATLSITTNDQGNTGSGGAKSDSDSVNITVNAVNDAPVNAVPPAQTTNEDTPLVFSAGNGNAISISDVDAGANPVQLTLTVTNGTLTLNGTTGLSFSSGTGTADTTMTFSGTITNINAALNGLSYAPAANFNGADMLSITTNDLGHTGSGGPLTASDAVNITVNAVNDAPLNNLPGAQAVNENSALIFSTGNGNAISISDVDAGNNPVQVTLTATNGTLTLNGTTGLAFSNGSGAGDATMTFSGTITDINTALNGMVFHPASFYYGPAAINITTNDQGNTGAGGPLSAVGTVNIAVNFVNFGPSLSTPGPQTSDTYGLVFSTANGNPIVISDASVGSLPVQVTLTATSGTFNLPSAAGITINSGGSQDSSSIVFTGTVAEVNSALNGLVFYGTSSGSGLQISVSDQGNAGGPALSANAFVAVDQMPVFPAPSTPNQAQQTTTVLRLAVPSGPILAFQTVAPKVVPLSEAITPRHGSHAAPLAQPAAAPFALVTTRNETADSLQMAMRTEFFALRQTGLTTRAASLNMDDLWTQIDTLADQFNVNGRLGTFTFAMTGLTAAFSAGYVLWCMHGSSLLASVLSALPAWKSFDPLPVLEYWDKDSKETDENEDDEPADSSDDAEELLDDESLPLQV